MLSRRCRRVSALVAAAALVMLSYPLTSVAPAAAAAAVPAATPDPLPDTVSADALPTVQINGVVWKQAIAGNTVYAGGEFTAARPAGAAPGVNTVPRSNLLAYDIDTGVLDPSFAPTFNGKINDMAVTPDGTKLVVVGNFTQVNGVNRYRVAVFNLPSGTLSSLTATLDAPAYAVALTNTTMFLGGNFSTVAKTARKKAAAVSLSNGAVLPFTVPVDNNLVRSIAVSPDASQVVLAGTFTSVGGSSSPGYGLYRADALSGAKLALPLNNEVRDAGANSGILRLASDGTSFYGGGYHYGSGGNSEGMFQGSWADGSLVNLEDCHGDTYDIAPVNNVTYIAGHQHYCGNSGGFPQTNPWTIWNSSAWTKSTQGTNTADIYGYPDHPGTPRPGLLAWFPRWDPGTYTGQNQATWTVTGNSKYMVYGGEFTAVNGTAQQGLVRFAARSAAPNKQGPRPTVTDASWGPSFQSYRSGQVKITWPAMWDRDDKTLTYKLMRDTISNVVYTGQQTNFQWDGVPMSYIDTNLTPGSTVQYYLRATDAYGNNYDSGWFGTTVASTDALSSYGNTVLDDGASKYWPLNEPAGSSSVLDWAGSDSTTARSGVTRGTPGAMLNSSDAASTFNGTVSGLVAGQQASTGPNVFTEEVWFKTTSRAGGKIAGFGSSNTGDSGSYDRHIYMDTAGKVYFGVYPNATKTINSPTALNNGQWHQVVASLGSDGMNLYVDGRKVASRTDVTSAQAYTGYWRLGGDNTWSGGKYFNGSIDDFSLYPSVLTPRQVDNHWVASGRTTTLPPPTNTAPTAAFFAGSTGLAASFDASTSTDSDGTIASYSWNFGDATPAGSGVKPTHTYAAAGKYTVTLTVTDDKGATGTVSHDVTVTAPNAKPTAAFTSSSADLVASFDGTGSADTDGTIASYSWNFGDGTPAGTGAKPSHTYATPNTYTVTLTVTDDGGATDTVSHPVTVTTPGSPVMASDDFSRTVASGWGTADVGGAWTVRGGTSNFSVSGGAGKILVSPGSTRFGDLQGVKSDSTVTTAVFSVDSIAEANYVAVIGRQVGSDYYVARLRLSADGTGRVYLLHNSTQLGGTFVPAFTFVPGQSYTMAIQVKGTSPTTISAKLWKTSDAEPAAWAKTTTDSSAVLQTAGYPSFFGYLPSTAPGPVTVSFDKVTVRQVD